MAPEPEKRPPRYDTKARKALNTWREKIGLNQAGLAGLLGGGDVRDVNQSLVSRWCTGHSRPDPMYQVLLERLARIECKDWLTTEERDRVAGCAREATRKLRKLGLTRIGARRRGAQ